MPPLDMWTIRATEDLEDTLKPTYYMQAGDSLIFDLLSTHMARWLIAGPTSILIQYHNCITVSIRTWYIRHQQENGQRPYNLAKSMTIELTATSDPEKRMPSKFVVKKNQPAESVLDQDSGKRPTRLNYEPRK